MSKKTEIKVYLPTKMVGELESKKKLGVRSKFIAQAIRNRLDGETEFDLWDVPVDDILSEAVVRLRLQMMKDPKAFEKFCRSVFQ